MWLFVTEASDRRCYSAGGSARRRMAVRLRLARTAVATAQGLLQYLVLLLVVRALIVRAWGHSCWMANSLPHASFWHCR
jgi:hypothetical protein